MRRTEEGLIPTASAIAGARPVGRLVRRRLVGQRDDPIDRRGRQRRNARGPGLVAGQPGDPFAHKALLPAPYHCFVLADGAGDGVGALALRRQRTMRARQTCFCGLLRSRTIASNRTRSAGVSVIDIPLRIAQGRTKPRRAELKMGVFCQVLSTKEIYMGRGGCPIKI
jgi:hypothetical protein